MKSAGRDNQEERRQGHDYGFDFFLVFKVFFALFLVVFNAERSLAAIFFFFLATAFVISCIVIGTLGSLRVDFRTTDFMP